MTAVLTADQIAAIRTWVPWDPPTDAALEVTHQRLDLSWRHVAREHVRAKLQDVLANPSSLTIPGEYAETRTGQIAGLEAALAALDAEIAINPDGTGTGTGTGITIGRMVRAGAEGDRTDESAFLPWQSC